MAKSKTKTIYSCQNCGAQRARWEGRCTDCGSWNTLVEETVSHSNRGWVPQSGTSSAIVSLDQSLEAGPIMDRWPTGSSELDRVLGGGLVKGSFVLLGGSPGVGKSTLLLQAATGLATNDRKVFYVSGEESAQQISSRAHRLGLKNPGVFLSSESNLDLIFQQMEQVNPSILVLDSIQTLFLPTIESAPGTVSQVRECAGRLLQLAKSKNISIIVIGHITKEGNLAGPKVLEHMVDCVLSFEGDSTYEYRILRSLKNRFGPAFELAVFSMRGGGLIDVPNPSEIFLQSRQTPVKGAAIFASIEGTRPLLCEIQALAVSSPLSIPRRTTVGIDLNRLHLMTAVMDRFLNANLYSRDLYVNAVGGLSLQEPAADLAIVSALISTLKNKEIPTGTVVFGEIGLTGEVRAVSHPEFRVKEAFKLGFKRVLLPEGNRKNFDQKDWTGEMKWISKIQDLENLLY